MSKVKWQLAGVFWVLLIFAVVFQIYGRSWDRALFIDPIYRLETEEKVIALTFDDGPSATRTPALLELLDKHEVKATFFMVGRQIEKYPEIAEEVVNKGHMAGNHSYSHPRLIFKSPRFVREEVIKTDQLLKSIGSEEYEYFRPPYTNKFLILPWVLKNQNMKLVTGTYDPGLQYNTPFPAQEVSQQVIGHAQPGSIIYLHDGSERDSELFIEAVDRIIVELRKQGYRFVTLKY